MAEKSPTEKAAPDPPKDPTIRSLRGAAPEYPEGTHPIAPLEKQAWGPDRFVYKDHPDKPDPSTVAQIVEEKS